MIANIVGHIELAEYQFKHLKPRYYTQIAGVALKQIARTVVFCVLATATNHKK